MDKRWTSPVAIGSMLALIYFVVKYWIGFEIPNWDEFVTLILACGIAFGIFNDPTTRTHF